MADASFTPLAVKTTCPYCGTGCGVDAIPQAGGAVAIKGDAEHPANFGKLCVKGSALGETVGLQGRLLQPLLLKAGNGKRETGNSEESLAGSFPAPRFPFLEPTTMDAALDAVAAGFQKIITEHGPEAVAFYVSGQLLTEDYYACNKFVKGWLGHANIDTNSRLCMSSAVAGHKRAFGEDLVPVSYDDLELADTLVLVGSNTAWCHPILFQRMVKAKEARPELKIVVIDPRRTATTELADLHLPVKSGTDVWLFNGLLNYLHEHGVVDTRFVNDHTEGGTRALAVAANSAGSVASVAKACGLSAHALEEFYALFARSEKVITCFSMGVNQSSSGTDKVSSIINCHLLTGRIGKPGAGPFSLTGQPNAMGGREVGGLANMLAAHMDFEPQQRALVQGFWGSPHIADKPGLKAVDLFEAMEAGKIKAVWIMATNPVVSLPNADQVKRALSACELVVVSDVMQQTDTSAYAHVLLPALAWGEKDGTVTNSERRISRQRCFLPAPGEAKADWWMVAQVAQRMGFDQGFNWQAVHEIFDEHARLSGYGNAGRRETGGGGWESPEPVLRAFDISGLAGMDNTAYNALEPVRWPVPRPPSPVPRLFQDGLFFTKTRKAQFIATPPKGAANGIEEDYPLILNTGRMRDHWHTMTRTGMAPTLANHSAEPFVDLHPQDALLSGVKPGELAWVSTRWGKLVARVRCSGEMPRRTAFVPIHWNNQFASDARVGKLVNPVVDPVSGEPEFKNTPCAVKEFRVGWHGFVLARSALPMEAVTWWTRITGSSFLRYEIAGRKSGLDWPVIARAALGITDAQADWLEYEDKTAGLYRASYVVNDRIEACLFISPRPDLPSRAWLSQLFDKAALEEEDRIGLLVGEPLAQQADTGPTVCSCFGVGRNVIRDAIKLNDLKTPKEVTACVKAGGNCGSCVPEIKKLIAECAYVEE